MNAVLKEIPVARTKLPRLCFWLCRPAAAFMIAQPTAIGGGFAVR
ncbi:hypothetical protein [Noviherbaspirillum pedocola]|nr:hypothetical protein [Noviherbaspirillum pedocola]